MNEQSLLEKIRRKMASPARSGIVTGIGDDAAVFRQPGAREDLLFTTDMSLEGVHFLPEHHPPEAIGYKALARGLSDIAAMGGRPRFFLVSLALSPWTDEKWVDRFYDGMLELAAEADVQLAGGDLAYAEKLSCDLVVCGSVVTRKAILRSTARAGDWIYVSGELGGAALGLETREGNAWERHLRPTPRLELGQFLGKQLRATSAMDLSDGLSLDLRRLCLASGLSAVLDNPVPLFPGATAEHGLHGGDDYELIFTVRPDTVVPARHRKVALTRIGIMEEGRAGKVKYLGRVLPPAGYDHFQRTAS